MPEKDEFLKTVKNLTNSNGKILISVRNGNSIYQKIYRSDKQRDFTFGDWQELFSSHFKIINIVNFKRPLIHQFSVNGIKQILINILDGITPFKLKYMHMFILEKNE